MSEAEKNGDWYCKNCGYMDGSRVTYSENCDECGLPVQWHEVNEISRIEELEARIAALEAELQVYRNIRANSYGVHGKTKGTKGKYWQWAWEHFDIPQQEPG